VFAFSIHTTSVQRRSIKFSREIHCRCGNSFGIDCPIATWYYSGNKFAVFTFESFVNGVNYNGVNEFGVTTDHEVDLPN